MAVLQYTAPVIRYLKAQVLPVQPVPFTGQVMYGQFTAQQPLFQLVADHDMQAVGDLIRFDAHQGGTRLVDRLPELQSGDALHIFRESLRKKRVQVSDKFAAAPEYVLIEPALAFMHGHGDAAIEHGIGQIVRAVQIIEGVAALVHHAEEGGGEIIAVFCGDPHIIAGAYGCGKRMLRCGEAAVLHIDPHDLHHIAGQLFLPAVLKRAVQAGIVHLRGFLNGLYHRHDARAHHGEEGIALFHGKAFLIFAQPMVVRILIRLEIRGKARGCRKNLFKIGLKHGEIALLLRLMPYGIRHDEELPVADILLHGDLLLFADIL